MKLRFVLEALASNTPKDKAKEIILGSLGKGQYAAGIDSVGTSCWRVASNFLSKVLNVPEDYNVVILGKGSLVAHVLVEDRRHRIVADAFASHYISGSVDTGTIRYSMPIKSKGKTIVGPASDYSVLYTISLAEGLKLFKPSKEKK